LACPYTYIYGVTRLLLERRPVNFTPGEQRLYDLTFQRLEPGDFLKLVKIGEWKTCRRGDKFLTRGEPIGHIAVPIAAKLTADATWRDLARLQPEDYVAGLYSIMSSLGVSLTLLSGGLHHV